MSIFQDHFARFPIGQLAFDYSAVGEYHCLDLPTLPAGWVEATNHTSWGALGNWQIVEDAGRRVMQQARLREHGTPMLAVGDVHALQGDSECSGTGIECEAEVTLTAHRVADPIWPALYLVRDDRLMLFGHGDSVDEAAWAAVEAMSRLLSKLTGLSETEGRRLLSTVGDVRISQIVNPKKTCRAIIPRDALPEHWPF